MYAHMKIYTRYTICTCILIRLSYIWFCITIIGMTWYTYIYICIYIYTYIYIYTHIYTLLWFFLYKAMARRSLCGCRPGGACGSSAGGRCLAWQCINCMMTRVCLDYNMYIYNIYIIYIYIHTYTYLYM